MTSAQFVVVVLALAAAGAWTAVRLRRLGGARRTSASPASPPAAMSAAEAANVQAICEETSGALSAHVALLVCRGNRLRLLACAPRRPRFELLDKVAADWAITHSIPTGRGTGVMTASDWQFRPVLANGMIRGLMAIAGRGAREPVAPERQWLVDNAVREAGKALAGIEERRLDEVPVAMALG